MACGQELHCQGRTPQQLVACGQELHCQGRIPQQLVACGHELHCQGRIPQQLVPCGHELHYEGRTPQQLVPCGQEAHSEGRTPQQLVAHGQELHSEGRTPQQLVAHGQELHCEGRTPQQLVTCGHELHYEGPHSAATRGTRPRVARRRARPGRCPGSGELRSASHRPPAGAHPTATNSPLTIRTATDTRWRAASRPHISVSLGSAEQAPHLTYGDDRTGGQHGSPYPVGLGHRHRLLDGVR